MSTWIRVAISVAVVFVIFVAIGQLQGCSTTRYDIALGDNCSVNIMDESATADSGSLSTVGKVDKQMAGDDATLNDQGDGAEAGNPDLGLGF